jgi:hypothetical protein
VDFSFVPHLNNSYFPNLNQTAVGKCVEGMAEVVYALDDESALVVRDGKVTPVSEGTYRVYGPS